MGGDAEGWSAPAREVTNLHLLHGAIRTWRSFVAGSQLTMALQQAMAPVIREEPQLTEEDRQAIATYLT